MSSASAISTQAAVPAATVPLACSCDVLQRAQLRLEALTDRCSGRVDRLQQAVAQLQALARFDPFAVDTRVPQRPGDEAVQPPRRRRSGVPPSAEASRGQQRSPAATPAGLSPEPAKRSPAGAVAGPGAPALAARGAAPHGAVQLRDLGAALDDLLDGIGTLTDLGARQVAELMQRHAMPTAIAALSAGAAAPSATAGNLRGQRRFTVAGFDPVLAPVLEGVQALSGGPLAGRQEAMRDLADALGGAGQSTPQPLRAVGLAPMALTEWLLDELARQGIGGGVGPLPVVPATAAPPRRQAAPRASSRLVGQTVPSPGDKPAPEALDALADAGLGALETGEALARQISRLLLDQAWMRGVDLK